MVVLKKVSSSIVAEPFTAVQTPSPVVGSVPSRVALSTQRDWSTPALTANVLLRTVTSLSEVHPTKEIVHLNTLLPSFRFVTSVLNSV